MKMAFIVLAILAGIALVAFGLRMRSLQRAAAGWPRVPGRVIESRVDDADLEYLKPVLRYEYEVSGTRHVGFRVSFSGYGVSKAAMQQSITPYPVGHAVQVSYDPAKPSRAVLDNTASSDWLYWFACGLGFLGLGLWLLQP